MSHALRISNFKGIRRVDIGLERLTVIGPNASGKTSILEGLHHLSQMGAVAPKEYFRGQNDPLQFHRRGADGQAIELYCWTTEDELQLRLGPPKHDFKSYEISILIRPIYQPAGRATPELVPNALLTGFAKKLRPAELLRLDAARMVDPLAGSGTRMTANGTGLAASLAFMALNQPDDFHEIQDRLRGVVPSVKRIRFDQVQSNSNITNTPNISYRILFDYEGAGGIPAHLASEGTILVLGLLTALMGLGRPDVILLDDLDRGLHPKAQRELVGLLRIILEQNPDLQIVATSHSPYLEAIR